MTGHSNRLDSLDQENKHLKSDLEKHGIQASYRKSSHSESNGFTSYTVQDNVMEIQALYQEELRKREELEKIVADFQNVSKVRLRVSLF